LIGCASGKSYEEVAASMAPIKRTEGRIYFVRPEKYVGLAIQPNIRLNGDVVGQSTPGGFFYVDRPPGDYKVSTVTEIENSVDFHLNAGETKYIETHPSIGLLVGHIVQNIVYPEQGVSDVKQAKYTGSSPGAGS
jgi:Protein of unknown function (DUF2846)